MKINGEKGLGNILKVFLEVCFYIGIVILILLPFALKKTGTDFKISAFIIYPNGIVLLVIARQFIKLFNSLKENNPFCENNIRILKNTSRISLIGALLWVIDLCAHIVLKGSDNIIVVLTLTFMSILFIGVSIALFILSELFKEAVNYKRENELTI